MTVSGSKMANRRGWGVDGGEGRELSKCGEVLRGIRPSAKHGAYGDDDHRDNLALEKFTATWSLF